AIADPGFEHNAFVIARLDIEPRLARALRETLRIEHRRDRTYRAQMRTLLRAPVDDAQQKRGVVVRALAASRKERDRRSKTCDRFIGPRVVRDREKIDDDISG